MPERPLLILPKLGPPLPRQTQPMFIRENIRLPGKVDQANRFSAQFESMVESIIDDSPDGASTENILVLETVGKIENFKNAASRIPGLEWQAEVDIDDIISDDSYFERPKIGKRFFKDRTAQFDNEESKEIQKSLVNLEVIDNEGYLKEDISTDDLQSAIPDEFKEHAELITETIIAEKQKPLAGRVYLSLSNRQALDKVKSLFDADQKGDDVPGLTRVWKDLFSHLKTIRYWDVEDRIKDTGIIDYWKDEIEIKKGTASTISFEIELSFSESQASRDARHDLITNLVIDEGGGVVAKCFIPEIRFHALKVELPVDNIEQVLKKQYGALFKSGAVMFFRPSAQCSAKQIPDGTKELIKSIDPPDGEPIVALFDGMPLANHALLNGFLIIDDPDNFSEDYEPSEYRHCTTMASLICHGELDSEEKALSRKLYVRPILKPESFSRQFEQVPTDVFLEDLIERSVRRMFEGDDNEPPSAPTVKIISLSVADSNRIFHRIISPTAKLLDWLSYKYGVLFCVSSGNVIDNIQLDLNSEDFNELEEDDKVALTIKTIDSNKRNRRLFSPSEAINVLSVGSLHDDTSHTKSLDSRVDILPNRDLPSPLSVAGHGFRSSIKPEILMPGGRQLFYHVENGTFKIANSPEPPGQRVAGAPVSPGEINRILYTRGSSNSTALASRSLSFIYDALEQLFDERGEDLPEANIAPLLKTLLVHSASWGKAADILSDTLGLKGHKKPKELARFLGYGVPDVSKSIDCTMQRATAIGFGSLEKDKRHEFKFPLPACLTGENLWRRLTITLGWLSPIGPENRKYRRAQLAFVQTGLKDQIGGQTNEAQWQQVKNGTIQHQIFEGSKVVAFIRGDALVIPVQCREDAGILSTEIPYGLAVSLEVKDDIEIPVYEEVKEGIEILLREQVSDRIR